MRDMKERRPRRAAWPLMLAASCVAVATGCGGDDTLTDDSPLQSAGGQGGAIAGQGGGIGGQGGGGVGGAGGAMGPMPGLGTMMMTPPDGSAGGPPAPTAGASGAQASGGNGGQSGAGAGSGGSAGQAGGAVAGSGGTAGGAPEDGMDPTSVCMGGTRGMDSDSVTTRGMTSSRNFALIQYLVQAPNKISRFQTILTVPKLPAVRSTLFIWPGLQHRGGSDPGRIGNGVLQPVLTWGPSCNPSAPREGASYMGWWISAMYVNLGAGVDGLGACAGGDAMDVAVSDRLYIDFAVDGTEWTQTVLNLANMETVDFTVDLEGQDQNWAIWDIETPGSSRPAEDTLFEKSVLTFTSPVTSCQPTSAPEVDYFSAPILSPDGLHCCIETLILKAMRN